MKSIHQAWLVQIEVTNVCPYSCAYCSRIVRHLRPDQEFFMDVEFFAYAIESLKGYQGRIGIIGGEPILHPQFTELCLTLKDRLRIPRSKLGLWTSGGKRYGEYLPLIKETFSMINYNEHNPMQRMCQRHQPLTVAIDEVVADKAYMRQLIDDCWVQKKWCPSIGPQGAFFCEVAYAWDLLLDGPGGYLVEPDWWKRDPQGFQDQVERYCLQCGMAIPMERELLASLREKITLGNLTKFRAHGLSRLSDKDVEIFDRHLTVAEMEETKKTWDPCNYREDLRADQPRGYDGELTW